MQVLKDYNRRFYLLSHIGTKWSTLIRRENDDVFKFKILNGKVREYLEDDMDPQHLIKRWIGHSASTGYLPNNSTALEDLRALIV